MSRTVLNKLLTHSFANYQLVYKNRILHNHNAHHLGSLYFLGVTDNQLEKAYKTMCKDLDPYEESPCKITSSNWRKHLGDKYYCKSYRDFFKEQLTNANNWQEKFKEFLLDNQQPPLINSLVCGIVHPLIHVGYAFELNSETVSIEAIAMTAVCYNFIHEVIDKLKPPSSPSKSALEILKNIRSDIELPINDGPGPKYIQSTVKKYNDRILFHYNQWNMNRENLEKTIEELFDLSVIIYGGTHKQDEIEYDFFLMHLLTGMHGVRSIFSHINNPQIMEGIIQQFFYFAIVIYITQARPEINEQFIYQYEIDEKNFNWNYVIDRTLNTKFIDDAHVIKVIRALRDAENVYGKNKNGLYLKTAVKSVETLNFDETWIGGPNDKRQLSILKRS